MNEEVILLEEFQQAELNKDLRWFCPPEMWQVNVEKKHLLIKPDKQTDFWQKTHYGFQADNGHFLYKELNGNFRLITKVASSPVNRYDQAGLMLRYSSNSWLKTSVEYIPDGNNKLGAVVTREGFSDWSSQELLENHPYLYHRITRNASNLYVDYSLDGNRWNQIRMCPLMEEAESLQAGIYACSPQESGYEAAFEWIRIESVSDNTSVYG